MSYIIHEIEASSKLHTLSQGHKETANNRTGSVRLKRDGISRMIYKKNKSVNFIRAHSKHVAA